MGLPQNSINNSLKQTKQTKLTLLHLHCDFSTINQQCDNYTFYTNQKKEYHEKKSTILRIN